MPPMSPSLFYLLVAETLVFLCLMSWIFLAFFNAHRREAFWKAKLRSTLMQGEQVIGQSMQCRAHSLFARRAFFAVTTERMIILKRHLLGGFQMIDLPWKNLKDAQISENILPKINGANILFKTILTEHPAYVMQGVPTDQAMLMYSKAQREEQVWAEIRHLRSLEEQKAKTGRVVVNNTLEGVDERTAS